MHFHHEVQKLKQREDKTWRIKVTDLASGQKEKYILNSCLLVEWRFVAFTGKADVPEGKGLAVFSERTMANA
jgi:malate dehydrogenase (quinone)